MSFRLMHCLIYTVDSAVLSLVKHAVPLCRTSPQLAACKALAKQQAESLEPPVSRGQPLYGCTSA